MEQLPRTLGELKKAGYRPKPIKEEVRQNAIARIRAGTPLVSGMVDYEDTILPQLERAILASHDVIFLGERGQGKTRLIRSLVELLDEYVPVVAGAELNDDPLAPISNYARAQIAEFADETQVDWLHRSARYSEKLATPDTSIADLVGEVDPIKVAEGRYLADVETLHFGMVPRTNRGIFAINELPDLPERIQVGLLNLLEERDVQVRGYKIRLPLDVMFVASANPEDYTNRGRLITPLKDRFGTQIRTHYPSTIKKETEVVLQEAVRYVPEGIELVVPTFMTELAASIAHVARKSSSVNQRSGVSVRMSIACYELLCASAIGRALRTGESLAVPRPSDLPDLIPAISGKIEIDSLNDSEESKVLDRIISQALLATFRSNLDVASLKASQGEVDGLGFTISAGAASDRYVGQLEAMPALRIAAGKLAGDERPEVLASATELVLEGLYLSKRLNRSDVGSEVIFGGA